MLCAYAALFVAISALSCAGSAPIDIHASGSDRAVGRISLDRIGAVRADARPRTILSTRPAYPVLIQSAAAKQEPAKELQLPPSILGKWCNDHKEIWIFGTNFLTHRQLDNTHEHRVRYKWKSDRMTVYVDGYPDEFLPLTNDGTRMKLLSSGLDSEMNGWLFWRCPDIYSGNDFLVLSAKVSRTISDVGGRKFNRPKCPRRSGGTGRPKGEFRNRCEWSLVSSAASWHYWSRLHSSSRRWRRSLSNMAIESMAASRIN